MLFVLLPLLQLPKNYAFSYAVKDQSSGDDFSHSQAHNGQSTKGEYRVKLPDGRMQIVSYTADNNGYRADVRYIMDEAPKTANYDERFPNYVHDFSNSGNNHDNHEQYRDNHIRDYTPAPHYSPTAAPSEASVTSTAEPLSPNHVNSAEYSGEYQVYPQASQAAGLGYYAEDPAPSAQDTHLKSPKELAHDVNYLLNLVTPTKHSLPLYQHAAKLKVSPQISYETTTKNSEHDDELYGGKYNYNPVKIEAHNPNKMRYHYETMPPKHPNVKQGQGFRPSLQSYYAPAALVNVDHPTLGFAQPVQANYVTLPREKLPFGHSYFIPSSNSLDNSYQANNIKNSEVKQAEISTTEESLTMRPHIKYNTQPEKLQNSKPLKSTILHQQVSPTPQTPKQYVSQTPSPTYYTTAVTTEIPFNDFAGTTLNSYEHTGNYHTKPIEEETESKPYKAPKKQFSKLVLPVTTIRPNYIPGYTLQPSPSPQLSSAVTSHQSPYSQHPSYTHQSVYTHHSYTPHPSAAPQAYPSQPLHLSPSPHPPQKFVYLQPSISPLYINSLEDNKPSLELSYLKEVSSNSVHLKHNADPTSQEQSEEAPRPYDSVSFSTAVSPSPTPLYTQASTSSEEYSQESLYSFVPSVRHEYDLGNAETSNYSSGSSEQDASSASSEEVSTTPRAEVTKRERKASTPNSNSNSTNSSNTASTASSSRSTIASSSSRSTIASSRRPQSNQDQRRKT